MNNTANSDLDEKIQSYTFWGKWVGVSINVQFDSTFANFEQPGSRFCCSKQNSWNLETKSVTQAKTGRSIPWWRKEASRAEKYEFGYRWLSRPISRSGIPGTSTFYCTDENRCFSMEYLDKSRKLSGSKSTRSFWRKASSKIEMTPFKKPLWPFWILKSQFWNHIDKSSTHFSDCNVGSRKKSFHWRSNLSLDIEIYQTRTIAFPTQQTDQQSF